MKNQTKTAKGQSIALLHQRNHFGSRKYRVY